MGGDGVHQGQGQSREQGQEEGRRGGNVTRRGVVGGISKKEPGYNCLIMPYLAQ